MEASAATRNRRRKLLAVFLVAAAAALAWRFRPAAPVPLPKEHANRPPLRGVRFQNGQSEALALENFRGKVVLLNIWATWCVPCRKEMPALDRLQSLLGGPAFEVVAVSIDHNPELVREFFRQYGIKSLAVYIDTSMGVSSALGVIGVPTTLLVDPEGREIWRVAGPVEWDAPQWVAAIRKHMKGGAKS